MNIYYSLIGLTIFFVEIAIYVVNKILFDNYNWSSPVLLDTGFYGVKIIVLILFFILLFQNKKISSGLSLVIPYSVSILCFHYNVIPISYLEDLHWWLELGNYIGWIAVQILIIVSLISSVIYYLSNKNKSSYNR